MAFEVLMVKEVMLVVELVKVLVMEASGCMLTQHGAHGTAQRAR